MCKQKKRRWDQRHLDWDIIYVWECEISLVKHYILATGNSRGQTSNQSGWVVVQQMQSRAVIKIVLLAAQTPPMVIPLARGHYQRNMKECCDRLNAKCFIVQNKDTERKLSPAGTRKMKKTKKQMTAARMKNTYCDQDSDISFVNDTVEEIDTAEIEEEKWIEYMKRSTATAVERMKAAKIECWIETHRRMKWRLAVRIASQNGTQSTTSSMQPHHLAVCTAEWCPPQDANRPALLERREVGWLWDDEHCVATHQGPDRLWLAGIQAWSRPINKDQTDFDWQGIQACYDEPTITA